MDIYLERYNLSKLNQEEIEKLNRPITSMGIETNQISSSKKKKKPRQDQMASQVFRKNLFRQIFRDKLTPILLNPFQKIAEEGKLQNSF